MASPRLLSTKRAMKWRSRDVSTRLRTPGNCNALRLEDALPVCARHGRRVFQHSRDPIVQLPNLAEGCGPLMSIIHVLRLSKPEKLLLLLVKLLSGNDACILE